MLLDRGTILRHGDIRLARVTIQFFPGNHARGEEFLTAVPFRLRVLHHRSSLVHRRPRLIPFLMPGAVDHLAQHRFFRHHTRPRRFDLGPVVGILEFGEHLTASENVELMLDLKGVGAKPAKTRAAELLDQVGLGDKRDSFPADLSGGQKQRVAIARALAGDPGIILADEPTAALDSHTGKNVMEMMSELAHKRDRAVVIVTHDSRVLSFADRVVKIEDGTIADADATLLEPVPAGILTHNFLQPAVNLA